MIVKLTRSAYTARMISGLRVYHEIIAITQSRMVKKQPELSSDVRPLCYVYRKDEDCMLGMACELYAKRLVNNEETVLFTAAFRTTTKHSSSLVEIHRIEEIADSISGN